MLQIRDVLRLHWEQRLTMRQIAQSVGISVASVSDRVHRAETTGLDGRSGRKWTTSRSRHKGVDL